MITPWHRKEGSRRTAYALAACALGLGLLFCGGADAQQQRPRNKTSDRYVVNQTFDGQAFDKDNNVWVYTAGFAETFGMPPEGVDADLRGIEAAAFRVEDKGYQMCGLGGKAENCMVSERCVTDIYVDEEKYPLPWASDQRADWLSMYNSSRWLSTPTERTIRPKPPEGVVPNKSFLWSFALHPFADPDMRIEASYFQNGSVPFQDDSAFINGVIVYGYKRQVIAGLTVISLGYRCLPRNSEKNAVTFRLEARETSTGPTLRRFHEFQLPDKFERRIDARKKERDEQSAAYYRKLLESVRGNKP